MAKEITITNHGGEVRIDIEGVIGVPEKWQFEEPGQRIATYETFRSALETIKELKAENIVVDIRSTGGNVNDALLIYDALRGLGASITTRCFGYVASAATIIAQAASPGQREISGNSLYLIHRSVCSTEGNSKELEQTLEMLGQTDRRIADIYAACSGKNASEFASLMGENNGNGRWLSPREAIGYGLADRVIEAAPIKAEAKEMVMDLGLPPIPGRRRSIADGVAKTWEKIVGNLGGPKKKTAENEREENARAVTTATIQINAEKAAAEEQRANREKLEAMKARAAALPTSTKPKEDPSPQEMKFSQNENAYLQDLRNFV